MTRFRIDTSKLSDAGWSNLLYLRCNTNDAFWYNGGQYAFVTAERGTNSYETYSDMFRDGIAEIVNEYDKREEI